MGVALHSELGAQMAPNKPRPLQAASGTRALSIWKLRPFREGKKIFAQVETGECEYGTYILYITKQISGDPESDPCGSPEQGGPVL